jgi:hypothetical protein
MQNKYMYYSVLVQCPIIGKNNDYKNQTIERIYFHIEFFSIMFKNKFYDWNNWKITTEIQNYISEFLNN